MIDYSLLTDAEVDAMFFGTISNEPSITDMAELHASMLRRDALMKERHRRIHAKVEAALRG